MTKRADPLCSFKVVGRKFSDSIKLNYGARIKTIPTWNRRAHLRRENVRAIKMRANE